MSFSLSLSLHFLLLILIACLLVRVKHEIVFICLFPPIVSMCILTFSVHHVLDLPTGLFHRLFVPKAFISESVPCTFPIYTSKEHHCSCLYSTYFPFGKSP